MNFVKDEAGQGAAEYILLFGGVIVTTHRRHTRNRNRSGTIHIQHIKFSCRKHNRRCEHCTKQCHRKNVKKTSTLFLFKLFLKKNSISKKAHFSI